MAKSSQMQSFCDSIAKSAGLTPENRLKGLCIECSKPFVIGLKSNPDANVFTEAGVRETKISGFCERCWDKMFSEGSPTGAEEENLDQFKIDSVPQLWGEPREKTVYRKVESGTNTWLIPTNCEDAAGEIHVETTNHRGYGGARIRFPLEDGSIYEAHGPWHSNADSLYRDTGIDFRNQHRTFVVLARERTYEDGVSILKGIEYIDPPEGKIGAFNRYEELAKLYPNARHFYSVSRGGSSLGPINKE